MKNITSTIIITLVTLLFFAAQAHAYNNDGIYLRVGTGYKFAEADKISINGQDYKIDYNGRASARVGIAAHIGTLSLGVDHHSQVDTGRPFNDKREYYKTEFFIDKQFRRFGL